MNRNLSEPLNPAGAIPLPIGTLLGAYVSLTKPRIISLLLLTTLCAMVIARGTLPPFALIAYTLIGGAFMAAGANALNCYLDIDIDRKMSRTRNRPLVTGIIAPVHALLFGLALGLGAFLILAVAVNLFSALLALSGFAIYLLLYTRWKRTSPLSVLVGGIAGAMPPLVGWVAVTNSIDLDALMIFAIMVVWQVPHTFALTLFLYNDYARAGVPVLPVARGIETTQRQILVYSFILFGLALVPFVLGFDSLFYAVGAVLLGARFIQIASDALDPTRGRSDLRLYKFSLLYLALLFALMTADRVLLTIWHP